MITLKYMTECRLYHLLCVVSSSLNNYKQLCVSTNMRRTELLLLNSRPCLHSPNENRAVQVYTNLCRPTLMSDSVRQFAGPGWRVGGYGRTCLYCYLTGRDDIEYSHYRRQEYSAFFTHKLLYTKQKTLILSIYNKICYYDYQLTPNSFSLSS